MTSSTPTLRDVAAEAGVSPMTASNALRGKPGVKESTRAKVIAAAKKLNYRINLTASMLKSGRSNIIHVIVNEFDSPFYSKLTQALSNEIVSRGLIPFIEQTQYSPDAAEHALSKGVIRVDDDGNVCIELTACINPEGTAGYRLTYVLSQEKVQRIALERVGA